MGKDPDVYDHERLHSLNGGLSWCQERFVDAVAMKGIDTLKQWIEEVRGEAANQKAAAFADILLAQFCCYSVLNDFRNVEAPMRAAYKLVLEAHQKWEDARLATEQATLAWKVPAEDFRSKLKVLGNWAEAETLAEFRRDRKFDPNPFAYTRVACTWRWLKTPGDFVKYRDSFFHAINFIRERSEIELLGGRLEWPVAMSDFELSLKAFETAQAHVEARQNEEAAAKEAFDSKMSEYFEERKKAIALLSPLSEAGQWALFRLIHSNIMKSPEAG